MIAAIAATAFRECFRRPLPYISVVSIVTMSVASRLLHLFTFGEESLEAANLAISAALVAALVLAMFVGTALVRTDLERGTLALIRSQPVGLGAYVLGRLTGLLAATLLVCALTALGIAGALELTRAPEGVPYPPMALGWARVALAVPLISSVALAVSAATSRLFAPVLFLVVFLAGDVAPSSALSRLIPSLGAFGLDAVRAAPLSWLALYSGLYSVVFLMITYLLLASRPPVRSEG